MPLAFIQKLKFWRLFVGDNLKTTHEPFKQEVTYRFIGWYYRLGYRDKQYKGYKELFKI